MPDVTSAAGVSQPSCGDRSEGLYSVVTRKSPWKRRKGGGSSRRCWVTSEAAGTFSRGCPALWSRNGLLGAAGAAEGVLVGLPEIDGGC